MASQCVRWINEMGAHLTGIYCVPVVLGRGRGRGCGGVTMGASSKAARDLAGSHYRLEWRHRWRGADGVDREIIRASEAEHPVALQTLADRCAFATTRSASCNTRSSARGEPMRLDPKGAVRTTGPYLGAIIDPSDNCDELRAQHKVIGKPKATDI